jgi:Nucleotide-diphospho-sugar transferase
MHARNEPFTGSARRHEDSQGKHRGFVFTRRTGLLTLAFVIGLTFGVVMSQRVYVESNRPAISNPGRKAQVRMRPHGRRCCVPMCYNRVLCCCCWHTQIRLVLRCPSASWQGRPVQTWSGIAHVLQAAPQVQRQQQPAAQPRTTSPAAIAQPAASRPGCTAVRGNCELEAYLKKVAPGGEVMVAISNFDLIQHGGMLNTWIEQVQKAKVGPWMVLAIDEPLHHYLDERNLPNFLVKQEIAAVQQNTGSNHAVSALKFGILAEFLKLGWSVLLSDVDVVTLDDPFRHLYRDRDIEGAPLPLLLPRLPVHVHCWAGSSACQCHLSDTTAWHVFALPRALLHSISAAHIRRTHTRTRRHDRRL